MGYGRPHCHEGSQLEEGEKDDDDADHPGEA